MSNIILPPPTERSVLKAQMVSAISGIYAKTLEEAGFKSYNGENLSWYRVVNGEVLHSVYFISLYNFPLCFSISYGMHPLYLPARIPEKLYISIGTMQQLATEVRKMFIHPILTRSKFLYPGTGINCLDLPQKGTEILTDFIFPFLENGLTEQSAYEPL